MAKLTKAQRSSRARLAASIDTIDEATATEMIQTMENGDIPPRLFQILELIQEKTRADQEAASRDEQMSLFPKDTSFRAHRRPMLQPALFSVSWD